MKKDSNGENCLRWIMYIITGLLQDNMENGSITRRKRRKRGRGWQKVGKEMWLGWFPICCNHLCFGEKHLTHPSWCVCMYSCLWMCVHAHTNRSDTVFPLLNCRVLQGLSLALDLSVFIQTHIFDFVFLLSRSVFIPLCSLSFSSFYASLIMPCYFRVFLMASYLFPPPEHFDLIFFHLGLQGLSCGELLIKMLKS